MERMSHFYGLKQNRLICEIRCFFVLLPFSFWGMRISHGFYVDL